MKKICFAFNHLQFSDGVARSAISMANHLAKRGDVEITLRPIFKMEKGVCEFLDDKVIVKPVIGFYFNGLSKILKILPDKYLHDWIFGKNRYDIEIGFQHGISSRAVVSTNNNAKHIIWMHCYDVGLLMRTYFLKADKVICVSKFNADKLKREINENIAIDYCYNPIDEKKVIEQGKEEISVRNSNDIVFVSVGRLSEEKGYIRLIDVTKRLIDEGFKFKVWLIGDGPQREELRSRIKKMGLEEIVYLYGNQANPHKYTSKADVFICTSYFEGYSTACTEAIMLGVPVITTEVSGAMEIIEAAQCGSIQENTEDGIYSGMKKVLVNPSTLNNWKKILNRTRENFYADARIRKLEKILEL